MCGHKRELFNRYGTMVLLMMILFTSLTQFLSRYQAESTEQLMEENTEEGTYAGEPIYMDNHLAQCFLARGTYNLTRVSVYVIDEVPFDDTLRVQIHENDDSGTPLNPNDDVPSSVVIGPLIAADGLNNYYAWLDFHFPVGTVTLSDGERYWIVASSGQGMGQGYRWNTSNGDTYPDGHTASGGVPTWTTNNTIDFMFQVFGETYNDVGVVEIVAQKPQEVYFENNITAVIKNFGERDQTSSFDVMCTIEDSIGREVFNDTKTISSIDSGCTVNISWYFIPLKEDDYWITVSTLLEGDDYAPNNVSTIEVNAHAIGVLKLHDEINVNGNPTDWYGDKPTGANNWQLDEREFIWKDESGDDIGGGDYLYPDFGNPNSRFEANCLDLLEFRVAVDSNSINFLLKFGSIDDGTADDGTDGTLGFSEQIIEILIDMDRDGTGRHDTIRNARLKLDESIGWEYALWADGWGNGYLLHESGSISSIMVAGSASYDFVEISIPLSQDIIPDFEAWGYVVLIGAQDNNSLPAEIENSCSGFMKVDLVASPEGGGNGQDGNGADPNVYDMAFASPQSSQLNNYGNEDILLATFSNTTAVSSVVIDSLNYWAQSFIASSTCLLSSVDIYAWEYDSPSSSLRVSIETDDTYNNVPSGTKISSTEYVNYGVNPGWGSASFASPPVLAAGEKYWIVAEYGGVSGGYKLGTKGSDPWPGGTSAHYFGGTWSLQTNDLLFNASYRELAPINAHESIFFAPIVINEVGINGSAEAEWIHIYYNGTDIAPSLNMNGWTLTDQDDNIFEFGNYILTNRNNVTIRSGIGANTSDCLFWNRTVEVWHDMGDDVLLNSSFIVPVDYMSYTNGDIFGDPPPEGLSWESEAGEDIPEPPGNLWKLNLKAHGCENDHYSDWEMSPVGRIEEKTLYLHDDETFDPLDPFDLMNTTLPTAGTPADFDNDGDPGLTFDKKLDVDDPKRYQKFNLTPILTDDLIIIGDMVVDLYLDSDGGSWLLLTLKLYDVYNSDITEIASLQSPLFRTDNKPSWELLTTTFHDIDYTLEKGHYLVLYVLVGTFYQEKNLWLGYDAINQASCVKLYTLNFVKVEWVKTYDSLDEERTEFAQDEDVVIKANVSDPFGSYDIFGANIHITAPGESTPMISEAMTLDITDPSDPSSWKLFNYTFVGISAAGTYTVEVEGVESNGVAHIFTTYFNVLSNVPPILEDPNVFPDEGYASTIFNFTINCTDLDNKPLNSVVVNITGLGNFHMIEYDPSDQTYDDGKIYYVNVDGFINGTPYSYHFAANSSNGLWNETEELFDLIILNTPPTLVDPSLNPVNGNASTLFNFTINYTDIDDQYASEVTVNISGPSHAGSWDMLEVDPNDTDTRDGKLYYYNYTGFYNGSYSYHFWARDSKGAGANTTEFPGPVLANSPPTLINPAVSDNKGYITTKFNYTVTYIDLDNQRPNNITVNISGPSHAGSWVMIEADPLDTDYTDGKDYYYTYTGFVMGLYTFHFAANDSRGEWHETDEILLPEVLNTPPTLGPYNLDPTVGIAGTTVFTYTVIYTDLDDHPPGNITVNITENTGIFTGNFTMIEVNPLDEDYTDGKEYYYTIILPLDGNYTYRFYANDSAGAWAIPQTDNGPNIGGNVPVLSLAKVSPVSGITTTWFNFTVKFTDLQNDTAGEILLYLSGPMSYIIPMAEVNPSDTNTTNGKYFYYNFTGLVKGEYSFRVKGNQSDGIPAISSQVVPYPTVQNSRPQISSSVINESDYGGSWFNFTLIYKDIDNDTAGNVNLNIPGLGNFTMIPLDPFDDDWSDGKEFYYNISIPKGSNQYRFEVNDTGFGHTWNITGFKDLVLRNNEPIVTEQEIQPPTGFGGDYFNFTSNISDLDNDTITLVLYIVGETFPFIMEVFDPNDTNTSDGKLYFYNMSLPKGTYFYYFSIFDGDIMIQTAQLELIVKNNPPSITTSDVINIQEDDVYNVNYEYIDLDGDTVTWSLDTNASSWLEIDSNTGLLEGLLNTPNNLHVGSYFVNVSVDDGDGGMVYHYFTLNVTNTLPLITTIPDTFAKEDNAHYDNFECIDDDQGNILYALKTNASSWLTMGDSTEGILIGSPSNIHVGWYWVNVTVSDGNGGSHIVNYTLTVNNTPPALTDPTIYVLTEGEPFSEDFNCDDDNQGEIVYSLSTNATWFTSFNTGTGVLSGSPDNSDVGWYWVDITVTDGNGGNDSANYTITVLNENDDPEIITNDDTTAIEDELYYVDYNATDIDPTNDDLNWSLDTNATWLGINETTGILSGTPINDEVGFYWVYVNVTDGNDGNDSHYFILTVEDYNDPPVITTPNNESAKEDSLYEVDYNFTDVDDAIAYWYRDSNASWLDIDPDTGLLFGTPQNDDVGSYYVNITVTDERGASNYTSFTLIVNNTDPKITNIPIELTEEDELHQDDFNCTDDGQGNVVYLRITNASWLKIESLTGLLNGTSNNTHVGWYWINVTVSDGNGGSDFRNFTITVSNTPPTFTTIPDLIAFEDSLYTVDFNSSDDGQGNITYLLMRNASWLDINTSTGIVFGTPDNDDVGTYWVNVTVHDGNGGMRPINYTLTVKNTNDRPSITAKPGDIEYVEEDSQYNFDFEYLDDDSDSIEWSISTNASSSWLTIDPSTGNLSGTPKNEDVGWYLVNITADDGNDYAYVEFILTVNNTNDPPSIPQLLSPKGGSLINTTFPTLTWTASSDPDIIDYITNYTLQFSTSSDFSGNVINITGLVDTFYNPEFPLEDRTIYYWRVQAFDSNGVGSGFQTTQFSFTIATGYEPPLYIGGLKSITVEVGEILIIQLSAYFQLGSVKEGLIFTCNYDEIQIDQEDQIAIWTPNGTRGLEDVIFSMYDGKSNVSAYSIDLYAVKEDVPLSLWERIFWPWSLLPLLLVAVYASTRAYKRRKERPIVEEAFLIYEDGRLITHESVRGDEELDQDILSSMLTGVKDLISDAFVRDGEGKEEKGLQKLEFGEKSIFLEKGSNFFIAIVFTGIENRALLKKIDDTAEDIENKYGDVLEIWDGDTKAFKGADAIVRGLLSFEEFPTMEPIISEEELTGIEAPGLEEAGEEKVIFQRKKKFKFKIKEEEPGLEEPEEESEEEILEELELELAEAGEDEFLSDLEDKIKELESEGVSLKTESAEETTTSESEEELFPSEDETGEESEEAIETDEDKLLSELEEDLRALEEEEEPAEPEPADEKTEYDGKIKKSPRKLKMKLVTYPKREDEVEGTEQEQEQKPAEVEPPASDEEVDLLLSELEDEIPVHEKDEDILLWELEEEKPLYEPKKESPPPESEEEPPEWDKREEVHPSETKKKPVPIKPKRELPLPPPPGSVLPTGHMVRKKRTMKLKPKTSPTKQEKGLPPPPPGSEFPTDDMVPKIRTMKLKPKTSPKKQQKELPPPPSSETELTKTDLIKKKIPTKFDKEIQPSRIKTDELSLSGLEQELIELEREYEELEKEKPPPPRKKKLPPPPTSDD